MSATLARPVSRTDDDRSIEQVLLRRYRAGDLAAREQVVERMRPFACRLAARYRHSGEPLEDLEQVACVGLLKAIDRYDPEMGPFRRFAVPSILGELKRHFRDRGWGVHVPRSLQERFLKVSETVDQLSVRLGRSPTARDVAVATGLSLEEVVEALDASSAYSPIALDAPHSQDGDDAGATLADTLSQREDGYERVELGHGIGPAFKELPEREQEIVFLRFVEDLTQSEIAERVGVSQMHVSRLLRRSLDHLARASGSDEDQATVAA